MKTLASTLCVFLLAVALSVQADGSFRLPNGKLIQTGMSKQEVIYVAGAPMSSEVETIAIDEGAGATPTKREILTYRLGSSLGGMALVVVAVENSKVVSVDSKHENRM